VASDELTLSLVTCRSPLAAKTMETPKEKLKKMVASSSEPALTDGEIDELLIEAGVEDPAGRPPPDEDWSPTYDLNAAAAQGWLIKAARAAATVDEPTAGVVTSRIFENCRAMARLYSSRRKSSVVLI
jgi:hypothetical protein